MIGGHHAVHNDVLGCLHGNLGLDAQAPEQLVGDGAQLAVVVERDEGLPVQLPQVHRLPLSQPVALRDQQDDLVLTDEGPFHPGVVDFSTEEQVDLSGQQLVPQLHEGGLLVELEAHPHPVGLG